MAQPIYDSSRTLEAFLHAAAARQPTPGGGSVAALVGALSAAMGEMVLNYSAGRKDLAAHEEQLREVLAEYTRARQLLLSLMTEDQAAYDALTTIRREGGREDGRYPAALLACVRVPQAIAATGVAILDLCDKVGDRINPHLSSDLAVCAELAMATVRCSLYNARVNLSELTDAAERSRFETANARTLSNATDMIERVLARIWSKFPSTG
jgi:methenyltetrahydrofolate cyclohydrolase